MVRRQGVLVDPLMRKWLIAYWLVAALVVAAVDYDSWKRECAPLKPSSAWWELLSLAWPIFVPAAIMIHEMPMTDEEKRKLCR